MSKPIERTVPEGQSQPMCVYLFESCVHVIEPKLLHTSARPQVRPQEPLLRDEDERSMDVRSLARVRGSNFAPANPDNDLVGTDATAEIVFRLREPPTQ